MEGGHEVHSRDRIWFGFKNGKLEMRRRAISLGDEKSQWRLLRKEVGEAEQQDGEIVNCVRNPFED